MVEIGAITWDILHIYILQPLSPPAQLDKRRYAGVTLPQYDPLELCDRLLPAFSILRRLNKTLIMTCNCHCLAIPNETKARWSMTWPKLHCLVVV